MSGDAAVQKTNDDATQCKAACVALGYFQDDFVRHFVRKPVTKPPLINRGYYARQKSIAMLREQFMRAAKEGGAPCQVLSLGAGYDTTYFQLKSEGTVFSKYVELDFDEVACKKTMAISSREALRSVVEEGNPCDIDKKNGTLTSPEYCLLPADLRNLDQVDAMLEKAGMAMEAPTFILSECVLVYMRPEESEALLKNLASKFSTSVILVYEQIKPDSMFGRQMIRNLEERGAPLYGAHCTPTLEAHQERLLSCGWRRSFAEDMLTLYRDMLDPRDRMRVEGIEMFDEFEEWHLIMSHYCVSVGVKDKLGVLHDFAFKLDKAQHAVPHPANIEAHPAVLNEAGFPTRRPLPNAD